MSIRAIIDREISEVYNTPELRAAYRAGMSTAAVICDHKADSVRENNPGRRRGEASVVGAWGVGIAKGCGDAIMEARDTIRVNEEVESAA